MRSTPGDQIAGCNEAGELARMESTTACADGSGLEGEAKSDPGAGGGGDTGRSSDTEPESLLHLQHIDDQPARVQDYWMVVFWMVSRSGNWSAR
jgi:hypothetical protein